MGIKIRIFKVSDFSNGFLDVLAEYWPVDNASAIANWKKVINNQNHIYVAVDDEKVIGTLTMHLQYKFIRSGGIVAIIEEVIVSEKYRKTNIGKKLVKTAIKRARELGCYKITLQCENDIVGFYEKCGMEKFRYNIMGVSL